jgi:hypothetical protein
MEGSDMADERMKNEPDKNLGAKEGQVGQGGQQAPGRNPQDDKSTQQKPGQGGQSGQRSEEEDFEKRPGTGERLNQ